MKKNKEWLKEEIDEIVEFDLVDHIFGIMSDQYVSLNKLIKLIDQLDEPEKVVIPQFVADYIEKCKDSETNNISTTLNYALSMEYESKTQYKNVYDWLHCGKSDRINSHQNLFARAWLDGYQIEQEKKYRVSMPNGTYLVQSDIENYEHWFNERVEMYDNVTYVFTEQEIKEIDERYWAFAEEVTE